MNRFNAIDLLELVQNGGYAFIIEVDNLSFQRVTLYIDETSKRSFAFQPAVPAATF
jgi:hypothetical protein